MFSRYGRYLAAFGGLTLAILLVGESQGSGIAHRHQAQHQAQAQPDRPPTRPADPPAPKPSCHNATTRDDANYCESVRAAKAANNQAKWAFWQLVVSVIGIGFVVVTLIYTGIAATAARKAAEAIPVLERAYLYPLIKDEDVAHVLKVAEAYRGQKIAPPVVTAPDARIVFKNFGKTPATLIYGEVSMGLIGTARVGSTTDLPIKYSYVLGENDESDPFSVTLDEPLTLDEAKRIEAGQVGLVVGGFMNYRDIWGTDHVCPVSFSYNTALKRLDAHVQGKKKPAHGGPLSRLLPSHWGFRRKA